MWECPGLINNRSNLEGSLIMSWYLHSTPVVVNMFSLSTLTVIISPHIRKRCSVHRQPKRISKSLKQTKMTRCNRHPGSSHQLWTGKALVQATTPHLQINPVPQIKRRRKSRKRFLRCWHTLGTHAFNHALSNRIKRVHRRFLNLPRA